MDIMLQIQVIKAALDGTVQVSVYDYTDCVREIEFTTQRYDSPGKLTFSCVEEDGIGIPEGSLIELSVAGKNIFKGYVFTAELNRGGETSYTAYDQLRYLKANASYTFENMTLGQIIQQIAADFGLVCGTLEDTGYAFPCLIKENEGCLDIIFDALSQTIIQTGRIYNFYDDSGALTLVEAKNMLTTTLIGDGSLVTDFTYKRDIDSDTYNRIKLVRANSTTGKADTYIHEDSETIKRWGLLQYYDQVDENMNDAQIDEMCKQYLQYYNRVLQTITLESLGVPGVRGGSIVPVNLGNIEELSVSRLLLAEKVTHKFEADVHTMKIEVKNFQQLGGMSIV